MVYFRNRYLFVKWHLCIPWIQLNSGNLADSIRPEFKLGLTILCFESRVMVLGLGQNPNWPIWVEQNVRDLRKVQFSFKHETWLKFVKFANFPQATDIKCVNYVSGEIPNFMFGEVMDRERIRWSDGWRKEPTQIKVKYKIKSWVHPVFLVHIFGNPAKELGPKRVPALTLKDSPLKPRFEP